MNDLIQAKAGEILFFYTENDKLVYMLVSLGNGLFSGNNNSKLGAYLNNSNSIIIAEQIGNFVDDKIERYAPELGKLKVYAAQPYGSTLLQNTIKDVAQELTSEQIAVFQEDLRAILTADNNKTSVSSLLTNIKNIDNVIQLSALPAGRLIFFYNSDYSLKSMMISLGEGKFVISQGDHIGLATKQLHDIVSVDQFTRVAGGRFNYTNIVTGTINLQRIRQKMLLGQNSVFNLEGNKLFIKPQGRPSIINYMDSTELSNIIEGLAIKLYGLNNWQKVETIELQSCFGGLGSIPSGQVIAHKLDKTVIVHAFSIEKGFLIKNYESAPTPKIYEADVYLSDDDLKLAMQQSLANSEFWQQLILLFENSDKLINRVNDNKFGLKDVSGHLVFDMAKLILKKWT